MAYGGCEIMRRETNLQEIIVEKRISSAEAVRVSKERADGIREPLDMEAQVQHQRTNDRMYVGKRDLVTFIAGVINSTAEVK